MFLLSFPLRPDFPGYLWFVPGLLHLWRSSGLLQWIKDSRDSTRRGDSEVTCCCCLELSHVGWAVFTRELFCGSSVLLSSTVWGCSWLEGCFREAWRLVMRGMMLLLAPPSPGTLESPEIITSQCQTLTSGTSDKLEFCKHFSKMIFCDPDWLGWSLYILWALHDIFIMQVI